MGQTLSTALHQPLGYYILFPEMLFTIPFDHMAFGCPAKGSFMLYICFFPFPLASSWSWLVLEVGNYFEFSGMINKVTLDACYNKVNAWTTVLRRMLGPASTLAIKRASEEGVAVAAVGTNGQHSSGALISSIWGLGTSQAVIQWAVLSHFQF